MKFKVEIGEIANLNDFEALHALAHVHLRASDPKVSGLDGVLRFMRHVDEAALETSIQDTGHVRHPQADVPSGVAGCALVQAPVQPP